jgi:peptidoglycan/LPS O-acetylase OafA/YrhL
MVGAPAARLPHAPALDGVRGLAVAAVVVFHAGAPTWLPGGFLGVSLFFTLSGYLITSLILTEVDSTGRLALGAFWARRIRRLVPAMLLTLGGVLLLRIFVALPDRTSGEVIGGLTYSSNWFAVAHQASYAELFRAPSALAHLWSLAIEEQIYIAVPLFVWLVCHRRPDALRRSLAVLSIAAIAGSLVGAWVSADRTLVYFGTHTRAGELAAGVLLALVVPFGTAPRRRPATGWGIVGLIVHLALWRFAAIGDGWLYAGGLTACALASVAIIDAAMRPGMIARLFNNSGLRWLGRISYGLYLAHWPVTVALHPSRFDWNPTVLFVLRAALSLLIAAVSARWFESPIRRRSDERPARLVGGCASALFVMAAAGVVVIDVPNGISATASAAPIVRVGLPGRGSASETGHETRPDGQASDVSANGGMSIARIAVFGDSVPNWLLRDGQEALVGQPIELVDATIEGCDGALGMPVGRSGNGDELPILADCLDWSQWYPRALTEPTDVAVLAVGPGVVVDRQLNGAWAGPCDVALADWYRADIAARLTELGARAARVELVLPVWATDQSRWINPTDHLDRMDCVRGILQSAVDQVNGRAKNAESARFAQSASASSVSADQGPAVEVIDLGAYVCPNGRDKCRNIRRVDGVHFDPRAAPAVVTWLLSQLSTGSR